MANKTKSIPPKFDFSNVDIEKVDPDTLEMGSIQQDCVLIANTFERGAHATPTEAAIFATLTRNIQNNKTFALTASDTLSGYLRMPQEDASESLKQAESFAASAGVSTGGTGGSSAQTEDLMQSLNIGTQKQTTHGSSFGDNLLKFARDCIPCDLRLVAFLELKPNIDLLGALDSHLKAQLKMLTDVGGLLNNVDAYGDFCSLLDLLSFMCIPDLQRIIAVLMALFMLEVPNLDGLIGMLQALIAPLFAPILMSITSLLDQFNVLVTNPLDCVIDAIEEQLKKLRVETPYFEAEVGLTGSNPLIQVSNGLEQLNEQVQEAVSRIRAKLDFYIQQVKAMLGDLGSGDAAYLQVKLRMLKLTRMISFVIAIIMALTKGHIACSSKGKPPGHDEIDNFFKNYLSPNSPFNIWVDDDGQIHIDEQIPDFDIAVKGLPEFGNVFQFEGTPLLDSPVAAAVEQAATSLAEPVQVKVPCKLEISAEDVEEVNAWIAELNQT